MFSTLLSAWLDDTTELQAAIDAAAAGSGKLVLTRSYQISRPVIVKTDNFVLDLGGNTLSAADGAQGVQLLHVGKVPAVWRSETNRQGPDRLTGRVTVQDAKLAEGAKQIHLANPVPAGWYVLYDDSRFTQVGHPYGWQNSGGLLTYLKPTAKSGSTVEVFDSPSGTEPMGLPRDFGSPNHQRGLQKARVSESGDPTGIWIAPAPAISGVTIQNGQIEAKSEKGDRRAMGLTLALGVDCKVENVSESGASQIGFALFCCRDSNLASLKVDDEVTEGGGNGYGVQFSRSYRCELDGLTAGAGRHAVVFHTGATDCRASHVTDNGSTAGGLDWHGGDSLRCGYVDCTGIGANVGNGSWLGGERAPYMIRCDVKKFTSLMTGAYQARFVDCDMTQLVLDTFGEASVRIVGGTYGNADSKLAGIRCTQARVPYDISIEGASVFGLDLGKASTSHVLLAKDPRTGKIARLLPYSSGGALVRGAASGLSLKLKGAAVTPPKGG